MVDSRGRQGNYQMSFGHLNVPENKELLKNDRIMSKGHRNLLIGVHTSQVWEIHEIKINNDSDE